MIVLDMFSCQCGSSAAIRQGNHSSGCSDSPSHLFRPVAIHRFGKLVSAWFNRAVHFTDKHVADAGGAYWLLDEIALAQRRMKAVAAGEHSSCAAFGRGMPGSAGLITTRTA